jgi:hypothetical protein
MRATLSCKVRSMSGRWTFAALPVSVVSVRSFHDPQAEQRPLLTGTLFALVDFGIFTAVAAVQVLHRISPLSPAECRHARRPSTAVERARGYLQWTFERCISE